MTFAIGCFLLGNFISIFQVLDIEIPIEHFRMYFCCFSYFFYFFAFLYKIIKECTNWEKSYLLCDICIVVTSIFTLEWYIFNNPTAHFFIFFNWRYLSFICFSNYRFITFFYLGLALYLDQLFFNAKNKLYIFYYSINWIG